MKFKRSVLRCRRRLLSLYALLLANSLVNAAVITWDGGGVDAKWATANNWSNNRVPESTDDVVFGTSFSSGVMLSASVSDVTIHSLSIDSGIAFTLATGSRTLILTSGGLMRTAASSNNQAISGNVELGANGIWEINGTGNLNVSAVVDDGTAVYDLSKEGSGSLVLSGSNRYDGATIIHAGLLTISGSTTSTAVGVHGGTLIFDYTTDRSNKVKNTAALTLGGGTLQLTGGTVTEAVGNTTIVAGASSVIRSSGASKLTQGALTRNVAGGTVNYGAADIASTSTLNTNGILGGWVTVGGTDWATGSGLIEALASYTNNTWGGAYNTTVTANSSPVSGSTTNSLRFNATGAYSLTLSGINTINSGGILVTGNVGNNLSAITGGTLRGASGMDLVVIQNNTAAALSIASVIADHNTATALTKSGAGRLNLSGDNTYTGPTYLNQGVLAVSSNANLGSQAMGAQLMMNGGTLRATDTFGLFNGSAGINNRAIILGSNGGTMAVAPNDTLTVAGVISGTGALTKSAAGTLLLTGANTYTGATLVSAGTLNVTGSLAAGSNLTLGSAAILTGSGTIGGSVTVASGIGEIIAGNGGSGTLSIGGNLTFDGSGTIQIGTLSNYVAAPAIGVAGALVLNGAAGSVNLVLPDGSVENGTYQLFSYGATFSNLDGFSFAGPIQGESGSSRQYGELINDTENHKINYVVSADNLVWSGANGGIWTTGTTGQVGTAPSWATELGHQATDFWTGDKVEFNDTVRIGDVSSAPTTCTVSVSGHVIAGSILFDNSSLDYTVSGATASDTITAGVMVKTGSGTLTFSGAHTYTGLLLINAGKLVVGEAGVGSITSSVTVGNGATLAGSGVIHGPVTVQRGGTLTPGNASGVLTTDSVTFNSGSIFEWEIDSSKANPEANRGIAYDGITSAGVDGQEGVFKIVLGSSGYQDAFWNSAHRWTDIFTNAEGQSLTGWTTLFTSIEGDGLVWRDGAGHAEGQGYFTFNGASTLSWTAVPEPSTAIAGLLLAAGLIRRRRA